jgi:lysine 6-dehydrogenase
MRLAVIGAGLQAQGIVHILKQQTDITEVIVGDIDFEKANLLVASWGDKRFIPRHVNVTDEAGVKSLLEGCDAAISTVPYEFNSALAKIALDCGVSFCDLGGNNSIVSEELSLNNLALNKNCDLIPDLGLAPGLVSILAAHAVEELDDVDTVELRVGGLPQSPGSLLNYTLSFSIKGLINEYVENAVILKNGKIEEVPSLEDFEKMRDPRNRFKFLEAFTTSGGISTLPETFKSKIRNINYKTIRYPGHGSFFRTAKKLGLLSKKITKFKVTPRCVFEDIAENAFKTNEPDVVILLANIYGQSDGIRVKRSYEMIETSKDGLSAMVRCTGYPAAIGLLMLAKRQLKKRGAVVQELALDPHQFLAELEKTGLKLNMAEFRHEQSWSSLAV